MKKLFILLLITTAMAWAQPRGEREKIPMLGCEPIMEKLALTLDQQKKFDQLQTEMEKKQIELRSKIQTLRLDVRDLFRSDEPNKSSIESKFTEISKVQNDVKLSHIEFWFDVKKILTPEQQKVWKEHRMMREPNFRMRHQSGEERGSGYRGKGFGRGMGIRNCQRSSCR